jgi:hypothetical protein
MNWLLLIGGAGAAYYFLIYKRGSVSESIPTPDVKPTGTILSQSGDVYGNEVVTTISAPWRQSTIPFSIPPEWARKYQWKNIGSKTAPSWQLINIMTGENIPVYKWNDIMEKIS